MSCKRDLTRIFCVCANIGPINTFKPQQIKQYYTFALCHMSKGLKIKFFLICVLNNIFFINTLISLDIYKQKYLQHNGEE